MHRIVLEGLDKNDIVHHKNENKLDNRKNNLVKMSRREHTLLHDNLRIFS